MRKDCCVGLDMCGAVADNDRGQRFLKLSRYRHQCRDDLGIEDLGIEDFGIEFLGIDDLAIGRSANDVCGIAVSGIEK